MNNESKNNNLHFLNIIKSIKLKNYLTNLYIIKMKKLLKIIYFINI